MRVWQCTRLTVGGVGGVEKHIAEVSAGLRRLGHEVHVGRAIPPDWLAVRHANEEPIIMHTHGDFLPNPSILFGKTRRKLTWIHVCHGTSIGRVIACKEFCSISGMRGTLIDFFSTRSADAAIAVGNQALHEARRYFKMCLPSAVIANGTDPAIFTPLVKIVTESRLIFVGRGDDRVKNVARITEACEVVGATIANLELWCAPGIDAAAPFVRNLGPLDSKNLATTLAKCRALILCSFYEGDPIVLHEAQALGLPVIVSDIPSIRDALRGYANTTFVDPHSVHSIAGGIEAALAGPQPAPSARIRDWTQVARDFDDFYRTLSCQR